MPREAKVKNTYDEIFGVDPLLLTKDKQFEYGEAMLRHLLLSRTLSTTLPVPLDLVHGNPEKYRRNAKEAPPRPPDHMCDEYMAARRERRSVDEKYWDTLSKVTMVADGTNSNARSKPKDRSHKAALDDLGAHGLDKAFIEDRLRIAAIGYRVKVSRLENKGYFDEELCMLENVTDTPVTTLDEPQIPDEDNQLGRTRPLSTKRIREWEKAIHSHIEKALDKQSKIVFLPEFAFPSNRIRRRPFTADIRDLSRRKTVGNHFLFAGTRHDERYNRGLIISKKDKKVSKKDWWHYKTASAKNMGENILGPYGRNFPSYLSGIVIDTEETAITVAICYDTYDPTTFLKLVLDAMKDQDSQRPKIILVPSFNPNDDFVALLRDISFLGRCTVVYVNGLNGDAKMFVCGVALSDIAHNYGRVMRTIKDRLGQLAGTIKREKKAKEKQEKKEKSKKARAEWRTEKEETPTERKRRFLKMLYESLTRSKNSRTLDHLITVEECPKCSSEPTPHGTNDIHCDRDILYYNVDPQLINDFVRFRVAYFDTEEFLPEPLRQASLRKELEEIKQAQAKRG